MTEYRIIEDKFMYKDGSSSSKYHIQRSVKVLWFKIWVYILRVDMYGKILVGDYNTKGHARYAIQSLRRKEKRKEECKTFKRSVLDF